MCPPVALLWAPWFRVRVIVRVMVRVRVSVSVRVRVSVRVKVTRVFLAGSAPNSASSTGDGAGMVEIDAGWR